MNLICGINPVLEALAAGTRHFDRLLVVKGLRNRRLSEAIRRATRLGIPLRFEMRETLDRMAGGVAHQGLIAVVSAKPVLSLESLMENASDPALLMALDGVEDPRNLGAVLRSVEASGADGALLPERHSAGLSEAVGRSSAGALEHVQVARVGNLVQALETLKSRGVWVVGFDATGHERWDAVDYRRPVCLVLGGEGRGIRRLVREHCDHLVSIPHFGHVSSLNVSVAAGIALYEVVRQRGTVPSTVKPIPSRPATAPVVLGPAADDAENDPGAAPVLVAVADDADEVGVEVPESASLPHVDIDGEDVAWGQAPTVLKPVRSHREGRASGWRRKSGNRRPRGAGPAQSDAEKTSRPKGPGGPEGQEGDREGRRRRRRKRRASGGARAGGTQGHEGGTRAPATKSPGGEEKAGSKGEASSAKGRRRRRRR